MNRLIQLLHKLQALVTRGSTRSVKAKKNILISAGVKGLNIAIGFVLVPLTIGYVDESQYGIWITLSSVVTWFRFFDVGLGNGMRNRFAEAMARGEVERARTYVSTTYAILGAISAGVVLVFFLVNPFLDWAFMLNADEGLGDDLKMVALIVFSFFALNFVMKLITTILTADQRPAMAGVFNLGTNALTLTAIFILTKTTEGSLVNLAWVLGGAPVFVLGLASFIFYNKQYKAVAPSFRYVDRSYFNDLISLGWKFFVIQVIGIIIFSTDNVIITQLYGPAAVTPYNIAFKYFGIITKVFTIVSAPFWSAYTEAYTKMDVEWIKRTMKKLIMVWRAMAVLAVGMVFGAEWFYSWWVPTIKVPFLVSVCMAIYVVALAWGTPFVVFMNGVGKVRLQLTVSLVGGILNIPLSIFFAKYLEMGSAGIILATTLCVCYGFIIAPIQYRKIINQTATGIWNR